MMRESALRAGGLALLAFVALLPLVFSSPGESDRLAPLLLRPARAGAGGLAAPQVSFP